MPNASAILSAATAETKSVDTRLGQDFKAWLKSLQSGNPSAELAAFTILKNDFLKSPQSSSGTPTQTGKRHSETRH